MRGHYLTNAADKMAIGSEVSPWEEPLELRRNRTELAHQLRYVVSGAQSSGQVTRIRRIAFHRCTGTVFHHSATHSADNASACRSTVSVASSCRSGGYL